MKMKPMCQKVIYSLIILSVLFVGCSKDEVNINEEYFHVKGGTMYNPRVYEYSNSLKTNRLNIYELTGLGKRAEVDTLFFNKPNKEFVWKNEKRYDSLNYEILPLDFKLGNTYSITDIFKGEEKFIFTFIIRHDSIFEYKLSPVIMGPI